MTAVKLAIRSRLINLTPLDTDRAKAGWCFTVARLLLLNALALFLFPSAALANFTAYYVDCGSANPGSGSIGSPWNSVSAVNSKAGGFGPGDSILFKAGTSCVGTLKPVGSGASGAPITISPYGSGARPIINGNGLTDAGIHILNMSYVTVTGMEVTNTPGIRDQVQRNGILVEATDNLSHADVIVHNNVVRDVSGITGFFTTGKFSSAGINYRSTYEAGRNGHFIGLRITNNYVHDVFCIGITTNGGPLGGQPNVRNSDVIIRSNTVERSGADGIVVGASISPLIEYNVVRQAGYQGVGLAYIVGLWVYESSDPLIQFNEVSATFPSGDSQAYDCDLNLSGTCTVQYNYSYNNAGGFLLDVGGPRNVVIRYNMSVNEGRIIIQPGSTIQFYNNTFYAPGYEFYFNADNTNLLLRNNIFVGGSFVLATNVVSDISRNLYSGFTPPAADASPISGDPSFLNPGSPLAGINNLGGYVLRAGSPALNAGSNIAGFTGNGGRDYFGNTVSATGAPNIGAYQGAGSTQTPSINVVNGGFESGNLTPWTVYGNTSVTSSGALAGTYAVRISGANGGVEQTVTGLSPNTTYALTANVRVGTSGEGVYLGAKNFGGPEQATLATSTSYATSTVSFTTGSSNTSASIYLYKSDGTGDAFADEIAVTVGSAPPPPPTNLVVNGGLETGSFSPWFGYGNYSVTSTGAATGIYATKLTGGAVGAEQVITGLSPGTAYTLTANTRVENAAESVYLGVKDFGGSQQSKLASTTSYAQQSINFTTGASNTSAKIFLYKDSGAGSAFGDDFVLQASGSPPPPPPPSNLAVNPGFETGTVAPWSGYGAYSISSVGAATGTYAVRLSGSVVGVEQVITGLLPNTTYVLSADTRVEIVGEQIFIGAKDFGGSEVNTLVSNNSYTNNSVTFVTGSGSTSAKIYFYKGAGSGAALGDNVSVVAQ